MNKSTKIYIIRHGESLGNISGKFNGITNLALTDKGQKQASCLQNMFTHINYDVIYSSPLLRAFQTAKITINNESKSIKLDKRLQEIDGGLWEQEKWENIPLRWPQEFINWTTIPEKLQMPEGESMVDFNKRCIKVFNEIINNHINETIVVFSHGTVIKAMQVYFKNWPLSKMNELLWHDNTGVFCIEITNGNYDILFENDTKHLPKQLKTIRNATWYKEMEDRLKALAKT
ncbi:MAG: histidine phosphatase family protein [Clostridiales bacterium]|nr:histidine phosphatase family protein [Clostridiales bacterium]